MSAFVTDQAATFLLTVVMGMALALVYDLLRMERRLFRHKNWLVNFQDFIYFFLGGVFIFYILFHKNYGQIRAFSLIGALIGIILYFTIFSEWVMTIGMKILTLILKPIIFLIKIIIFPFAFIIKWICKILAKSLTKSKNWVKIRKKKAGQRINGYKKRRRERLEKKKKHEQDDK